MALNINGTTGISGVDASVSAPALTGTDSNTGISFPAADTIKFSTGGVERMSITNSGISGTGLGVANITSTSGGIEISTGNANAKFDFDNSSATPRLNFKSNNVAQAGMIQVIESGGGGITEIHNKNTSGTQKRRFLIGYDGTSGHLSDSYNLGFYNDQAASGSYWFMRGSHSAGGNYGGGTDVFFVRTNGNVENANNSYGQSSDIKLKENVVDASSQWNDIKNLKVRKFNFKKETGLETHTQIGLIAQETELISAGLVEDVKDTSTNSEGEIIETGTVTKHIKYSVLYMKAVKALQEAQARIETLETKVAALEAK